MVCIEKIYWLKYIDKYSKDYFLFENLNIENEIVLKKTTNKIITNILTKIAQIVTILRIFLNFSFYVNSIIVTKLCQISNKLKLYSLILIFLLF